MQKKKPRTSYAYSLKVKRVREPEFEYQNQILSSPDAVHQFCAPLFDADTEIFLVCYLDNANRLICISQWQGTIDQVPVFPREVLKQAILATATGVIIIHNHLTGKLNPSTADLELTKRLKESLGLIMVSLRDHLIISEEGFYSFANFNQI